MNPKAKQELIDWLFSMIGTEHFNMSYVVGSKPYECGTAFCLLGAAEALASQQDISSESLVELDYYEYVNQIKTFYRQDYYSNLTYERALKWLGFNTSTDWSAYSLFHARRWPQPYQRIYLGDSNIYNYVVNDRDACLCRTFYRPLAGILLLTDMPESNNSYLGDWGKLIGCDDDESFYTRHEELIQRCISKFRTTL